MSQVARAEHGFMREYESAGTSRAMKDRPLPGHVSGGVDWGQKRDNSSRGTWSPTPSPPADDT